MTFSPTTHAEIFDQIIAAADAPTRRALAGTCWRLRRLIAPYHHLVIRCLGDGFIDVRAAPTWKLTRGTDNKPDYYTRAVAWDKGTLDADGVLPEFPPMAEFPPVDAAAHQRFTARFGRQPGPPRPAHMTAERYAALLANTRVVDIVGLVHCSFFLDQLENICTIRVCGISPREELGHQLYRGCPLFDPEPPRIVTPNDAFIMPNTFRGAGTVVYQIEEDSDIPKSTDDPEEEAVLVFFPLKADWQHAKNPRRSKSQCPVISGYENAIYPHEVSEASLIWAKLLAVIGPQGTAKGDCGTSNFVLVGLHDMDPGVFFPIGPDTNFPVAPDLRAQLRAAARDDVSLEFLTMDEYNAKHPFDLGHWPAPGRHLEGYCHCR